MNSVQDANGFTSKNHAVYELKKFSLILSDC